MYEGLDLSHYAAREPEPEPELLAPKAAAKPEPVAAEAAEKPALQQSASSSSQRPHAALSTAPAIYFGSQYSASRSSAAAGALAGLCLLQLHTAEWLTLMLPAEPKASASTPSVSGSAPSAAPVQDISAVNLHAPAADELESPRAEPATQVC